MLYQRGATVFGEIHDQPQAWRKVIADLTARRDELVAWCRERLSAFKCPRSVELVEDLGRNAMGKVSRRALRAPYWAGGPERPAQRTN